MSKAYTLNIRITVKTSEPTNSLDVMSMEGLKERERQSVEVEDYESAQIYKNEIDKRNAPNKNI